MVDQEDKLHREQFDDDVKCEGCTSPCWTAARDLNALPRQPPDYATMRLYNGEHDPFSYLSGH